LIPALILFACERDKIDEECCCEALPDWSAR